MRSIRQFLVVNLLIGVLFATNLAILSNLYFGYKSVSVEINPQMVVMAHSIDTFLQDDHKNFRASSMHAKLQRYSAAIRAIPYDDLPYLEDLHRSVDNLEFIVFNARGQLIAKSNKVPTQHLNIPSGFSSVTIKGEKWRTFKIETHNKRTIRVYQPHQARLYIEETANTKAIMIILLTIPPLGLFLWIIISRSLVSIQDTSKQIRERAYNNLNPIATNNIPAEIQPLIIEINSLFNRLHSNFVRESRFAADAAHELKTPLAALKTHVQVAQSMQNKEDIQAYLKKIITSVDRASHTIDQLLMLSRTMPDVHMREHAIIKLRQVVTMAIADLAPSALKKNIKLAFNNHLQDDGMIFGHEIALHTLISNLVDNAIRYTYEDTEIRILIDENQGQYILSVIDQGPGIAEELRERVFERFYRIIGNQQTGTGLGLNIVSQIVKLHNGDIQLETPESGIGLCVRVYFPKPNAIHTQTDSAE